MFRERRLTYNSEQCTQVVGQFNICWSNFDNPLRPLNKTRLNETFQSLSRASSSATAYSVSRAQLNGYTSTTSGASSAASSTIASVSATVSAASLTSSTPSNDSGGLSGGAIGGIAGGIVGGLALLGAVGFLLWRRKKKNVKINPYAPPNDPHAGYGYQPTHQPQQGYPPEQPYSPQPPVSQMQSVPPMDKYAHMQQPPLVEAPSFSPPVEMDANYHQQQHGLK